MRRGAIGFLAVALVGLVTVAIVAASESRTLAFTLGVPPTGPAATLRPGQEACQQPILVEVAFDAIELRLVTSGTLGPRLDVAVRPFGGTATIAHGTLLAGSADGAHPIVGVGSVAAGRAVAICVRNSGARTVALAGGPDAAARGSSAAVDGAPTGNDVALVLRRTDSRTTLALLPDMLDRAALFRGGWSAAWLYWALLAALVLAVPALVAWALDAATSTPASASGAADSQPRQEPGAAPSSGDTERA